MKYLLLLSTLILATTITAQTVPCPGDNDNDPLFGCADPDCNDASCSDAFACVSEPGQISDLYQIRFGNSLWTYDGNTWISVSGWNNPLNIELNAIGYNVQDGYIYGIQTESNSLVKVTKNGLSVLGSIAGLPMLTSNGESWNAGDMDLDGNLYVGNKKETTMYKVDVSTLSATAIPITNLAAGYGIDCSDWVFLPNQNKLYGLTTDKKLKVFNLTGLLVQVIQLVYSSDCKPYGALFTDKFENIYSYCNQGEFIQLTPNQDLSDFTVTVISTDGPVMTKNDGASCPLGQGLTPEEEQDCCSLVLEILEGWETSEKNLQNELEEIKNEIRNLEKEQPSREGIESQLFQNKPNPFSEITTISYSIKSRSAQQANIVVTDMNGSLILNQRIEVSADGEMIIQKGTLIAGMYLYSLVVDGELIDTKKMLLLD